MKDKIVLFCAGPYVGPVLEILNSDFDLDLVITTEANTKSTTLKFCRENDVKVLTTTKLDIDSFKMLRDHKAKVAVLASFGLIIPEEVLDLYPLGIINIHPSLLPKYRGATPIQGAILNGETETGVSIMKLDKELDHGPLLGQTEIKISETDTADSLYKKAFEIGARMLGEILPKVIDGTANYFEQDHAKATFTDRLTRESGYIDISKLSTLNYKLSDIIRAYHPWPGVWFKTELNGKEKVIKLLPENKIQVEGKNIMTFKDFANGYPQGKEVLLRLNLLN